MYTHVPIHIIHIYTHVHMCICIYIYIYIYTAWPCFWMLIITLSMLRFKFMRTDHMPRFRCCAMTRAE